MSRQSVAKAHQKIQELAWEPKYHEPVSRSTGPTTPSARQSMGLGGVGFPRNLGRSQGAGGHGPAFLATGVLPVRRPAP